jgi:hypothetical protein
LRMNRPKAARSAAQNPRPSKKSIRSRIDLKYRLDPADTRFRKGTS